MRIRFKEEDENEDERVINEMFTPSMKIRKCNTI